MPRLQFTKDVASTLAFYAPEGIPDGAATVTIYTGGDGELEGDTWPATVALGSASTTTTAAATQQSETLPVGDASAFSAGGRYWINDSGQRVEVEVRKKSGSTLYLTQPLPFTVSSGATIASGRYAYSLSATQTATLRRRLRAVWSYEVDSEAVSHTQYFSVVREPFDISLTEDDIEAHDHNFGEYAGSRGQWRRLIEGAHHDVERALRRKQLTPDLVKDRDGLKDALIFYLLSKFYRSLPGQLERAEAWRISGDRAIEDVFDARTWYDADDDNTVSDGGVSVAYDSDGNPIYISDDVSGELSGASELGTPAAYMKVG